MALHPNKHRIKLHHSSLFFLDFLYCTEEQQLETEDNNGGGSNDFPLWEETTHFLVCEDEELDRLLSKEQDQNLQYGAVLENLVQTEGALFLARTEAVEWLLKVNAFYGFSTLTALLAINYLDRVLTGRHFQRDKPWMLQLLAVTCISLAAKVEEVRVPVLQDLQVEDSKFIFEAKTIQRMELLVLSALQWKMHAVTPVSFLGIITKGLGLKKNQHFQKEFLRRFERILLSLVTGLTDSRSVGFLPSVMAVSAMVSVVEEMGSCKPLEEFQDQILNALKINKGRVKECCKVIMEVSKGQAKAKVSGKRKHVEEEEAEAESEGVAGSPNGVIEANFSCGSSNHSWGMGSPLSPHTPSSSKRIRPTP
ncbi:cyclin-D3-1-like isoform X1 [Cucurbita moschata]|uniref:B-like cyclin n=1 Tax=Cucurbita moschata TaxID=3662 RepID=A0A6J1GNA1_CUCMO|nr:cyclin-D3-1-like isoform X1 [Cucurbita moschata]